MPPRPTGPGRWVHVQRTWTKSGPRKAHWRNLDGGQPAVYRPARSGAGVIGGGLLLLLLGVTVAFAYSARGPTSEPPTSSTMPHAARPASPAAPSEPQGTHWIVQVASRLRRRDAETIADDLRGRQWRKVGVLRSDDYVQLRPGYWVTYLGPFDPDSSGQAQAEAAQQELDEGLVRRIRHR